MLNSESSYSRGDTSFLFFGALITNFTKCLASSTQRTVQDAQFLLSEPSMQWANYFDSLEQAEI